MKVAINSFRLIYEYEYMKTNSHMHISICQGRFRIMSRIKNRYFSDFPIHWSTALASSSTLAHQLNGLKK